MVEQYWTSKLEAIILAPVVRVLREKNCKGVPFSENKSIII